VFITNKWVGGRVNKILWFILSALIMSHIEYKVKSDVLHSGIKDNISW